MGYTLVFADDSFMGSTGGNVFPSKSRTIKMVREYVVLKLEKDGYTTKCTFWFYNKGKDIDAVVGFPDYLDIVSGGTLPLSNFTCRVNGAPQKVALKEEVFSADDPVEARFWFSWHSHFKSHDTTVIENEYAGKYGGFNYLDAEEAVYIIGTGRSWYGAIGYGRIVFDHSDLATTNFTFSSFDKSRIKMTDMIDSTVLEFNNLIPNKDESVGISVYNIWEDRQDFGTNLQKESLELQFKVQIEAKGSPQFLINEIYARHGYIFKNDSIQNFYRQRGWYKSDSSFAESKLNNYERETIAILKEIK